MSVSMAKKSRILNDNFSNKNNRTVSSEDNAGKENLQNLLNLRQHDVSLTLKSTTTATKTIDTVVVVDTIHVRHPHLPLTTKQQHPHHHQAQCYQSCHQRALDLRHKDIVIGELLEEGEESSSPIDVSQDKYQTSATTIDTFATGREEQQQKEGERIESEILGQQQQHLQGNNPLSGSGRRNHTPITTSNEVNEKLVWLGKAIQVVRDAVIERARDSPNDYYLEDINRIRNDDWSVIRFFPDDIIAIFDNFNRQDDSRRQMIDNLRIFEEEENDDSRSPYQSSDNESDLIDSDYVEDDRMIKEVSSPTKSFTNHNLSDVVPIIDSLDNCLRWRKSVCIRELTFNQFPRQFFQIQLFSFGTNQITGQKVVYIQGKKYKKFPQLTEHFMRFGTCLYEEIDRSLGGKKICLFIDLRDVSLDNCDIFLFRHFLDLLFAYFPSVIDQVYVYEVSWFLKPIVYLILKVVPDRYAKLISMIGRKDIPSMDPDFLPDLVGGNVKVTPLEEPSDTVSLDDYVRRHNLPKAVVVKATKVFGLVATS